MGCAVHDLGNKALNELIAVASGRDEPASDTCPGMRGHAVRAILELIQKENPDPTRNHKKYPTKLHDCLADNMVCHKDILVRAMAFTALSQAMFRPDERIATASPYMLLQCNADKERVREMIASRPAYIKFINASHAWCTRALTVTDTDALVRQLAAALRACKMGCTVTLPAPTGPAQGPLRGPDGAPMTVHDVIACRLDPYLAQHPNNVDALICRALICGMKGRYGDAVELCKRAVAAAPNDPFPLVLLGTYIEDNADERRTIEPFKAWKMYEKDGRGIEPECLHLALARASMVQQRWTVLESSVRRYLDVYSVDEPNYARNCYYLSLVTLAGLSRWPEAPPEDRLREFQGLVRRARDTEERNRAGYGEVNDFHKEMALYLERRYADRGLAERVTRDGNSMAMWWANQAVPVRCGLCGRLDLPGRMGGSLKKCSRCHQAYFCGPACQQLAWKDHKPQCKPAEKGGAQAGRAPSSGASAGSSSRLSSYGRLEPEDRV